ncbi:MAG TPA: polysaccharide biosynthesis/export family protein [Terriglobia bacterium]|nr:polysaccharide biosynthesis/export family protein [Terriglobia bacterium]
MLRIQFCVSGTLLLLSGLALAPPLQARRKHDAKNPAPGKPSASAPANYVINAGDVLEIQVWKEPDISKAVPVRPDGKISLPLIDDVQASGLTAMDLTAAITEKLKKFITDPQVTVIVTQVNSQHIFITGEVNRGGTYPLLPGMTALEALASAGGFTPFASLKKIYVLRQENGKQVRYPFNYKKVLKGKDPGDNIILKPGDTIVVP